MQNRPSKRRYNELRDIILEVNISPYAEGSCMAKFGNTHGNLVKITAGCFDST